MVGLLYVTVSDQLWTTFNLLTDGKQEPLPRRINVKVFIHFATLRGYGRKELHPPPEQTSYATLLQRIPHQIITRLVSWYVPYCTPNWLKY